MSVYTEEAGPGTGIKEREQTAIQAGGRGPEVGRDVVVSALVFGLIDYLQKFGTADYSDCNCADGCGACAGE